MIKETINKLQLVLKFIGEFIILILFSILFFVVMRFIDHQENQNILAIILIIFSISKVYVLISRTLKKMEDLIKNNHSFRHILLLSTIVIIMINISFTLDYLCVSEVYLDAFIGLNHSQPLVYRFFDLMYFSVVTFTTVGYGDIVPIAKIAKLLTMLEMIVAFVTIVFIISRYIKDK